MQNFSKETLAQKANELMNEPEFQALAIKMQNMNIQGLSEAIQKAANGDSTQLRKLLSSSDQLRNLLQSYGGRHG